MIGTSTNLIVNSFIENNSSIEPFKMFEFTKLGAIFCFVGIFYNLLIAKWILPSRAITSSLTQKYHMSTYLTEFKIEPDSNLIGKSISDFKVKDKYEFDIVKIIRNKIDLTIALNDTIIREDDVLLIQINVKDILNFKKDLGLLLLSDIKVISKSINW